MEVAPKDAPRNVLQTNDTDKEKLKNDTNKGKLKIDKSVNIIHTSSKNSVGMVSRGR